MGDILADDPTLLNSIKPKKHETLFGPALGPVNNGPAWTNYGKVENTKDELTQETVKAWIAKSKEVSPLRSVYHPRRLSTLDAIISAHRAPPHFRLLGISQPTLVDQSSCGCPELRLKCANSLDSGPTPAPLPGSDVLTLDVTSLLSLLRLCKH